MVNKNWKKLINARFTETVNLTRTDGTTYNISTNIYWDDLLGDFKSPSDTQSNYGSTGLMVFFGSGNTVATEEDITLESYVTAYTHVGASVSVTNNGNKFALDVTRTIKYTGEEDVEINEIGLYINAYTGSSGVVNRAFMIAREVLDEPVTMSNGDVCSFTFRVEE